MALPREEGAAFILPSAVEKTAMHRRKRMPTRAPIFQGSIYNRPARKLQEMKVAARQAGQGMDSAQNVLRDIS